MGVACRRNLLGSGVTAPLAGIGSHTGGILSGFGGDQALIPVMTQCRGYIGGVAIAAGAGPLGEALLGTGGRHNPGGVAVGMAGGVAGVVVGFGHGMLPEEFLGPVIEIRSVVVEEYIALQEIVVVLRGHIFVPGYVAVVVQVTQPDDVPGVALLLNADDAAAFHPQFQQQPVHQVGVALTHGGAVDQGGVGGVLQLVFPIVQMVIVIADVLCHVVINGLHLFVFTAAIQGKLLQQRLYGPIQLLLLGTGGVVAHVDGGRIVFPAAGIVPAIVGAAAAVVQIQVVAFLGLAGMLEGGIQQHIQEIALADPGVRVIQVEIQVDHVAAVDHLLAHDSSGFIQAQIIAVACVVRLRLGLPGKFPGLRVGIVGVGPPVDPSVGCCGARLFGLCHQGFHGYAGNHGKDQAQSQNQTEYSPDTVHNKTSLSIVGF